MGLADDELEAEDLVVGGQSVVSVNHTTHLKTIRLRSAADLAK